MARRKQTRGVQQGAQSHAEGEHGAKTREFIRREQITTKAKDDNAKGPGHDPEQIAAHDDIGKDRLFDDRQQHDEAEKGSEKTRQSRDMDRHKHDSADALLRRNRQNRARRA
ncbi:MAG TPA: hypothetical protein VMM17_13220 [Gemmatimonadaceae bacterium]|nr:hypothetical protein [Gemmatimonadaceae bacterium]